MAAYNAGAQRVLIPQDNLRDLEELDPLAREGMEIIPCRRIADVLSLALLPAKPERTEKLSDSELRGTAPFIPVGTPAANQVRFDKK